MFEMTEEEKISLDKLKAKNKKTQKAAARLFARNRKLDRCFTSMFGRHQIWGYDTKQIFLYKEPTVDELFYHKDYIRVLNLQMCSKKTIKEFANRKFGVKLSDRMSHTEMLQFVNNMDENAEIIRELREVLKGAYESI